MVSAQKGGEFRRWYGNLAYIVNWENDGYEMKNDNYMGTRVRSHNYNGDYGFKKQLHGQLFHQEILYVDYLMMVIYMIQLDLFLHVYQEDDIVIILALLNSHVANYYLKIMNPTINFPPGYIQGVPFSNECRNLKVSKLSEECISISQKRLECVRNIMGF